MTFQESIPIVFHGVDKNQKMDWPRWSDLPALLALYGGDMAVVDNINGTFDINDNPVNVTYYLESNASQQYEPKDIRAYAPLTHVSKRLHAATSAAIKEKCRK